VTDEFRSVGIVGLGYVGLPLAVAISGSGRQVIGLDNDPEGKPICQSTDIKRFSCRLTSPQSAFTA